MVKNVKYFAIFIILFMTLTLNVEAAETCIYNFPQKLEIDAQKSYLSIKIENGVVNPFYIAVGEQKITDASSNEWIPATAGASVKGFDLADKKMKYTTCPKYVYYKNDTNLQSHIILFSDNSSETGYSIKVDLKGDFTDDSQGNSCDYTNTWLEEPPKEVADDEVYCLYAGTLNDMERKSCYKLQFYYKLGDASSFKGVYNFEKWEQPHTAVFDSQFVDKMVNAGGCLPIIGVGYPQNGDFSVAVSATSFKGGKPVGNNVMYRFKSIPLANSAGKAGYNLIIGPTHIDNCSDLLGEDVLNLLRNLVSILRILIPIILNVFGIIDFGSAIFAGDEEKMQKAQKKFITRLIIGVVIFLIPSLLSLILNLANRIWPVIDKTCISEILD